MQPIRPKSHKQEVDAKVHCTCVGGKMKILGLLQEIRIPLPRLTTWQRAPTCSSSKSWGPCPALPAYHLRASISSMYVTSLAFTNLVL